MKKIIPTIITATMALFTVFSCDQFSTTYQRIDETEFRLLKMLWNPVDAAPGDTVTMTAVFAGKALYVDLDSYLDWWISFNMIRSLTGAEAVIDSVPLRPIAQSYDTAFSPHTRAVAFRIPIPSDIVRTSASIPERWTDMLPPELRGAIPPEFAGMTKDQVVDLLESPEEMNDRVESFVDAHRKQVLLAQILQFFTVPIRISVDMREAGRLPHTMVSNHSIRYNNRFRRYGAPVNYAPSGIYPMVTKIKGDYITNNFGPAECEMIDLDNSGNSTVVVEKGYSYFLEYRNYGYEDRTITMFGNTIYEEYNSYRQFQLDASETNGIHHSKFMDITNYSFKITMPTDKRITKFVFWLTITDTDNMTNERLRPVGATLIEASGRFVYK